MSEAAAYWCVIALFAMIAVSFGAMYYSENDEFQRLREDLRTGDLQMWMKPRAQQGFGNDHVVKLKDRVVFISGAEPPDFNVPEDAITVDKGVIGQIKREITSLGEQADAVQQDIDLYKKQYESSSNDRLETRNQIGTMLLKMEALRQQIESNRGAANVPIEAEYKKQLKLSQENRESADKARDKEVELQMQEHALIADAYDKILLLQEDNKMLHKAIAKKVEAVRYRQQTMEQEQYDGEVISVDPVMKFVAVDIGLKHNVHRGMRFDVIRNRFGKWDYMGVIELREVKETSSYAVILDTVDVKMICDQCGYIATDPEEKYCPYCASGDAGNRVVRLNRSRVTRKEAMKMLDTIHVGDKITNPFYSRRQAQRFVITGSPVRYSLDVLSKLIEDHGGSVQQTVGVDTDFLILGIIPDIDRKTMGDGEIKRVQKHKHELETAIRYGVPIMREVDLATYLRN